MASLHKRKKVWHVVYRLRGQQHSVTTRQIGRAPNEVARLILDKYRQREGAEQHGIPWVDSDLTVMGLVTSYWDSNPPLSATTARVKKGVLDRLVDRMGDIKVSAVQTMDADSFIRTAQMRMRRERKLNENTHAFYRAACSSLWAWGFKMRLLDHNPWAELVYKKNTCSSRRSLTDEEISLLLNSAVGSELLAIMLGLYQGARISDCVNIHGEDIDLGKKTLMFRLRKGSRVGQPKVHYMPLHPALETVFAGMQRSGRLLPMKAMYLGRRVKVAMKKVGIKASHHYLRHTFITQRINAGISCAQVSELAGHANWAITKRYSHINVESLRHALDNGAVTNTTAETPSSEPVCYNRMTAEQVTDGNSIKHKQTEADNISP